MLYNFWLRQELKKSLCLSVHLSVRPAQVCLEQSIFIFLGQRAIEQSKSTRRTLREHLKPYYQSHTVGAFKYCVLLKMINIFCWSHLTPEQIPRHNRTRTPWSGSRPGRGLWNTGLSITAHPRLSQLVFSKYCCDKFCWSYLNICRVLAIPTALFSHFLKYWLPNWASVVLRGAEQGSTDNTDSGTTLDLTLPVLNMVIIIWYLTTKLISLLLDTPAQPSVALQLLIVTELCAVQSHILPGLQHRLTVRQFLKQR